jgi:hypothetical protein
MINVEEEIEKIDGLYYRWDNESGKVTERKLKNLVNCLATERDKAIELCARLAIDCGIEVPTKKWVIKQLEARHEKETTV